MDRILKPAIFTFAAIYLLADEIARSAAGPIASWIGKRRMSASVRVWISTLTPYPTLALFAVPLIILEPVKPIAVYLAGTGRIGTGVFVIVVGEIAKLILVERLFSVSRNKLMSIPAFAWTFGKYGKGIDWLRSFAAWKSTRRMRRLARHTARLFVQEVRASRMLIPCHARPASNRDAILLSYSRPPERFSR